ncbi:hypothetical protein [Krasilnikovia sp. M28-CT-15]|uniref:hypothetical protein n=1 Tax=Krasilnikovia sp. M28-CT-15 TaxID=3373540 RepID=UPI00399C9C66
MATEVRVEPALLERGHAVCVELGTEVTRDEFDTEGAMQSAARGLAGWQTQRSVEDLSWWWHDYRAKLGGYLNTFGNALDRTAVAYRQADSASRDLFDIRSR